MKTDRVPHRWVAERMGYSIAGVSLLRGGHRQPTLATMEAVEIAFGWPICDQVLARSIYPIELDRVINESFAKEESK